MNELLDFIESMNRSCQIFSQGRLIKSLHSRQFNGYLSTSKRYRSPLSGAGC